MSITCPTPSNDNLNELQANNFILDIPKLPDSTYLITAATTPAFDLGTAVMKTPLSDVNNSGDKLGMTEFTVTMLVNKSFSNYLLFYYWMFSMSTPTNHADYQNFPFVVKMNDIINKNAQVRRKLDIIYELNNQTDMNFYILPNKGKNVSPSAILHFYNAFPTGLNGLEFLTTESDVRYTLATVSFKSDYMIPEVL